MNFYKTIRTWHDRYGINISLYIYEVCDGFSIDELPQKYWDEFRENDSWLKFCWHRRKGGLVEDDYDTEIQSFIRVKNIIDNKVSPYAWTDTVRLHRFEAGSDLITFLKDKGNISCLLCADDNRLSYDLTDIDTDILEKDRIVVKNDIIYRKTDIRLDLLELSTNEEIESLYMMSKKIIENVTDKRVVLFCHEWIFNRIYKNIEQYFQYIMN
jgi:hypothetical protein